MKKILIAFVILVALAGAYATLRFRLDRPAGQIASTRLSCSWGDYERYMKIMLESGEMTLGLDPHGGDTEEQLRMLAAYDALDLQGPQTVVVASYVPDATLFTQSCAGPKCTMAEIAAPLDACLMKTYDDCVYLALRFDGQDYCLIAPPEAP